MTALAIGRVINKNSHPLIDEYKGTKIKLAPGEAIDMDYYDYVEFKGQIPTGIKTSDDMFDGSGNQKAQSFKMIAYEGPIPHEQTDDHVCQACKGKFATMKQLDAHVYEWHLDSVEDKDLAQTRRSAQKPSRR